VDKLHKVWITECQSKTS